MKTSANSMGSRRGLPSRLTALVMDGGYRLVALSTWRTWFAIVSAVYVVGPTPVVHAEVMRNAGGRAEGGMGLDLAWYCEQRWKDGATAVNIDGTAEGWRCSKGSRLIEVSAAEACRLHYGSTAVSRVAPARRAGDLYCVLGLDLTRYCRSVHGAGSEAVKRNPDNPASWRCRQGGSYERIPMRSACRHHYGAGFRPVLGRHADPQAWTCEAV
jgi:hypothetical protein